MIKKCLPALLCATLMASTSGCATIVGAITGPFTGAHSLGSETYELADNYEFETMPKIGWTTWYGVTGFFFGFPAGIYKGFMADVGYFENDASYGGSKKYPPFTKVFHPFNFNHIK